MVRGTAPPLDNAVSNITTELIVLETTYTPWCERESEYKDPWIRISPLSGQESTRALREILLAMTDLHMTSRIPNCASLHSPTIDSV